jgi:hypothetical protein
MDCENCHEQTEVLHAEGDAGAPWAPTGEIVGRFCYACADSVRADNKLTGDVLALITARPGVDIGQIAGAVGVAQGTRSNPLDSPLNRALMRLRDAGIIRTNNQWGDPRFFLDGDLGPAPDSWDYRRA